MRISQRYNLNKSQAELDFIDIDTTHDIPLFVDPFFLGIKNDRWSIEATLTLRNFFQKLIDLIIAGHETEAKRLFQHLGEPNATCLGLSTGMPRGSGVGIEDANKIYDSLLESRAIQTGLIQDIEDNILFVDNFGKDKLSDMTTNIINKHLIEYTIAQCQLHNIPLVANMPSGYYWSRELNDWSAEYTDMLVVDGKPILLVPKGVVSFCETYTPSKYYNHFVLTYLQHDNLRMGSTLVKRRVNGTPFVTKKDLKERNPERKEFLRQFTLQHPEVLDQFKEEANEDSLKNIEIADLNIRQICQNLGERLIQISPGTNTASAFHNIIAGILELLFYPHLIYPVKEKEIHQGRKRIDIHFDNASTTGIFFRLSNNMGLSCQYVFVECKNYSSDPANPELDQLSGRFSVNRGRVGFLVCRTFNNKQLFIERCRDTYNDGRGLIIPLDDQDILNLLDNHNEAENWFFDNYISNLVRAIAGT
jgi:hypothetical protein